MVEIIAIGLIAWVLTGAIEDNIRSARGDQPRTERRGLRGYLDDRWAALADTHHRNRNLLDADGTPEWWTRKRIMGRRRALAHAGFKTDEDIARGAYHHRKRLGLIRQGVDPDTIPPPPGAPALKRHRPSRDTNPAAPTGVEDQTQPEPEPQARSWTPFTDPITDQKEDTMSAGEINSPNDVKAFADAMQKSLEATTTTIDTLNGIAAGIDRRITDHTANASAADTAAAGMARLGMSDAAAAAGALIEQQRQIEQAMREIVDTIQRQAAVIADEVRASEVSVGAISRAYQAQLMVADQRDGVGRGNLAKDAFLDGDV